jgi:hypothetical protein
MATEPCLTSAHTDPWSSRYGLASNIADHIAAQRCPHLDLPM